jgi:hypothetical protein
VEVLDVLLFIYASLELFDVILYVLGLVRDGEIEGVVSGPKLKRVDAIGHSCLID